MFISINGSIVKEDEATISPFDHGFMYGLGLFETFRIYDGHPFLLDDHFVRMQHGLKSMKIEWQYNRDEILLELQQLLNANKLDNAYVRYNISAGPGALGLTTETYTKPTVIIYMKPLPRISKQQEKDGTILNIRRNSPEGEQRLKSHHFFNNVLGKQEVGDKNIEGIFLTKEGYVAEGVVSNLFWVKDDVVYTPSVDTGILNGITRQFIIELLLMEGTPVKTGLYDRDHLLSADEVFVTNSIQEVVPIRSIDDKHFTTSNEIAKMLQKKYKKMCRKLWSRKELLTKRTES